MTIRPAYNGTATFDGDFWAVRISGLPHGHVGVTQGRDEDEALVMARDVVAMLLDVPEDSFDLELAYEPAQ